MVPNDSAPKKKPDVSLRYRVAASVIFGGMSLFLFGFVVFGLVRRANGHAESQTWERVVISALIALIAAAAAFFALFAWGALSDPQSRLGAWVQKRLTDAVHHFLIEAAMLVLMLIGFWFLGIK